MTLLTAIITHLPAERVEAQLEYLRGLDPQARFAICHGGKREEFDRLRHRPALFIEDPSLRGPIDDQSYDAVLGGLHEHVVADDPGIDLVYMIEYDQLILQAGFESLLREAVEASGADFLAKNCIRRNDTNWFHFHRFRGDAALNAYFRRISVREDPEARYGCLGSGMLMTRDALARFAALPEPPPSYLELFIPTAMHHLGLRVDDFDRSGGLYADVRWRPEFSTEEAIAAKRAGRTFAHPFKQIERLGEISRA
jgi:hypothetical protein